MSRCDCPPSGFPLCQPCQGLLARATGQAPLRGKAQPSRQTLADAFGLLLTPALAEQSPPTREERPLVFELPYPPSLNHLYSTVGNRRILSKAGRQYHKTVASYAHMQQDWNAVALEGRLSFQMLVICPDHRRRDLSNLPKVVEDSLVLAGVLRDDSQIDEVIIRRQVMKGQRRITVSLCPYPGV